MVGKRVGLLTEADRVRWLLRKGELGGFRVPGEWASTTDPQKRSAIWSPDFRVDEWFPNFRVDAIPEGRVGNDKPGADGGFVAVRFEGVLEVTDPAAFAVTVASGVGSAKGYGFGLLSVAPA
jgi:CRISPR system Cascade subunit CasE